MRRVLVATAMILLWAGSAHGAITIWGAAQGQTYLTLKRTPAEMDAFLSPVGFAQLWPGTEGQALPAYRAGVCYLWARYDAYRIIGTPFESWPRGVRQLRVDSLGVRADSMLITPRLGPASSAGAGGAIRIVDGVTFTTLAGALADKPSGAAGKRGCVFDPDSARLVMGRFANNTTLNDPALDRAQTVFSNDISIQGLNITETEAAHIWQTVWSGNGITGAGGFDRAVAGEWHDHELAAGAGNGLNLFRGAAFVSAVNSSVFEKDYVGLEIDSHYNPGANDTLNSIIGLESYGGINSGQGNVVANPIIGNLLVGINNGTGYASAIRGAQAEVQLNGSAGEVALFVPYNVTGSGSINSGGNLYNIYIPATTFVGFSGGGRQIPLFIAPGSGPAIFSDSTRSNKGLYLGGQFVNKIDGGSATLNFGAPAAVPGAVDLTITVPGAAFGDQPIPGAPITVGANYTLTAFVSAANTVTVRWYQHAGAAADPDGAGGTYTVRFLR